VKESAKDIMSGASVVIGVGLIGYAFYLLAISGVLSGAFKKK